MSWAGVSVAIGLAAVLAFIHPLLAIVPAGWMAWKAWKASGLDN